VLLCPELIFPSKTSFFGIYLEFSAPEITLKINISHVSESKSYQINLIYLARAVVAKGGKLFPWFAWCGLVYI
jgi:hypothetical protein